MLDIDRLDIHRIAIQFTAVASRLRVTPAPLRDQLERASSSIALNLAEGFGPLGRGSHPLLPNRSGQRALESADGRSRAPLRR